MRLPWPLFPLTISKVLAVRHDQKGAVGLLYIDVVDTKGLSKNRGRSQETARREAQTTVSVTYRDSCGRASTRGMNVTVPLKS